MCGIAGLFPVPGETDLKLLERIARTLEHRGPDDHGIYQAPGIGLLQTRLSIIDLETGHQPLISEGGDLVLVANGEIYNHLELRQELESRGHRFHTRCDCECILQAYREFGTRVLEKLEGMFAFALYDVRRQQLFLARDRLGIKPLFYRRQGACLYFASEIKALLAATGDAPTMDAGALSQCLQSHFSSGRQTPFMGVWRLQAGEALLVDGQGKEQRWQYWRAGEQPRKILRLEEAMETFDDLMPRVIDHHLRSDVPIGLFLSGGTDSSLLLALMHDHGYGSVHTFSLGFPGTGVRNELAAAAATAQSLQAVHSSFEVQREAMFSRLPLALWAADEFMLDHACLPTLLLAEQAAQHLKVVFTGEGGDEVFAGYGRYRSGFLKRLFNTLRGRPLGGFRASGNFSPAWAARIFNPQLLEQDWRASTLAAWREAPPGASRLARMQWVDIQTWLADDLLVKADRMLMAHGLEGRVPWLDTRVVEFGLSLADSLKVQGRTGKWFLRQWAGRWLAESLLSAPKSGFSVPVRDWLDAELTSRLEDLLPRQPIIAHWFKLQGVRALLRRQGSHGDVSRGVWALLCLALWQRIADSGFIRPQIDTDPLQLLADS